MERGTDQRWVGMQSPGPCFSLGFSEGGIPSLLVSLSSGAKTRWKSFCCTGRVGGSWVPISFLGCFSPRTLFWKVNRPNLVLSEVFIQCSGACWLLGGVVLSLSGVPGEGGVTCRGGGLKVCPKLARGELLIKCSFLLSEWKTKN